MWRGRNDVDSATQLGISFCTGYGGLERGLELAGVRHRIIAHVEIEAYAVANLVSKMEQGHLVPAPVWTNLKTFPMERFRGVDFITAGYPCQPFSCAGQRKGTDDPRHLWPYLRRIYQTIQPRWMFFENVEGHITLGLSTVISDLEEDGYRVKAGLFTAAEVGAPHRRKRVFILAESKSRLSGRSSERQGRKGLGGRSPEEVDDARRIRPAVGQMQTTGVIESGELADADQPRLQGRRCPKLPECPVKWPAGPGSPQHEWEEPRVTQPELGRAVDGIRGGVDATANRVDRLRLCGNGVVPQQTALAYKVLSNRRES
jgi:DNA (cytosine-5)-methyltransferase 1